MSVTGITDRAAGLAETDKVVSRTVNLVGGDGQLARACSRYSEGETPM